MFCLGGFWQGGLLSRGFLSGGLCLGGFCLGGFCPRTVISSIYDKYKPNDRKSFLNYSFVLKKLLIMLGKVEYAKCIPQMKTHSKQKELERVWELITKDHEWAVALRK